MKKVTLGKTGFVVNKNGFGALPIQRISKEDAAYLLRKAFDNGITYFDTARFYTDSEEKMGYALSDIRDKVIIATKTAATNVTDFWKDLETSLGLLKTDYIDLYQFHNPGFCPKPGDESGVYDAMLEAKQKGLIRHIGLTNHRHHIAKEAIESGFYETIQYPFSYISAERDFEIVSLAKEKEMVELHIKECTSCKQKLDVMTKTKDNFGIIDLMNNRHIKGTDYNAAKNKHWKIYYRSDNRPFTKNISNKDTVAVSNKKRITRC